MFVFVGGKGYFETLNLCDVGRSSKTIKGRDGTGTSAKTAVYIRSSKTIKGRDGCKDCCIHSSFFHVSL